LILFAGAQTASAQNLVPNPSFESFTACPTGLSSGPSDFYASSWSPPTDGSSDYYNACAAPVTGVSVPTNTFGSQTAHTGVAYVGFLVRPVNDVREYVQAQLTQPLLPGQIVQVEFWVSYPEGARDAIDRIGAYLSVGAVGPIPNSSPLALVPQVESPAGVFLNDESNWMLVSGTYTAAGGEDHITLGNFHDNASTNVQQNSGFFPGSYYYLDDVSVTVTGSAAALPIPVFSGTGAALFAVLVSAVGVLLLRRGPA
jgi:OmpA-OmpF porin, OOP family